MTAFRSLRVAIFLAVRSISRGNLGVTLLSVAMMIVVFISVSFLPALITGPSSPWRLTSSGLVGSLTAAATR